MEEGTLGAIPASVHVEEWVPQRDVTAVLARSAAHWPAASSSTR